MKLAFVSGVLALSMTVSGIAIAADVPMASPPPPPPPALQPATIIDPITGLVTTILTPVGAVIDGVAQPITTLLSPPPPPPPPAPVPVRHRRHRRHHAV